MTLVSPNLCGVMLSRLAMDHPTTFADIDRYFFGDASNPCRTRMELLLKYAHWLEQVYSQQYCNNDTRVMRRIN